MCQTEVPSGLHGLAGVHSLTVDGNRVAFEVNSAQLDGALTALTRLGVRSLTSSPPTLEELFLRHYGDELEDGQGGSGMAAGVVPDSGGAQ